jgi:hypothetical protein
MRVFNCPADVTTVVLVLFLLSLFGAVTVVSVDVVVDPVVVAVAVLELLSAFTVMIATAVVSTAPASFFTTVVALDLTTPETSDRIIVVVTVFKSALVTSVTFTPVTCLVETPVAETTVTVSAVVPLPTVVTFWTVDVELSVEFVTTLVTFVVCPWASPRASTMSAALTKPMTSNKY